MRTSQEKPILSQPLSGSTGKAKGLWAIATTMDLITNAMRTSAPVNEAILAAVIPRRLARQRRALSTPRRPRWVGRDRWIRVNGS